MFSTMLVWHVRASAWVLARKRVCADRASAWCRRVGLDERVGRGRKMSEHFARITLQ